MPESSVQLPPIPRRRAIAGKPGNRIWKGCGPSARKYERDDAEYERQRRYARSCLGADGEHRLPNDSTSLEARERHADLRWHDWRRADRRSGIRGFFGLVWHFVVTAGMFSSDPTTARQAMVIRAQEELKNQREISQSNRQLDRAQREEDMRVLARVFVDEVERRR